MLWDLKLREFYWCTVVLHNFDSFFTGKRERRRNQENSGKCTVAKGVEHLIPCMKLQAWSLPTSIVLLVTIRIFQHKYSVMHSLKAQFALMFLHIITSVVICVWILLVHIPKYSILNSSKGEDNLYNCPCLVFSSCCNAVSSTKTDKGENHENHVTVPSQAYSNPSRVYRTLLQVQFYGTMTILIGIDKFCWDNSEHN